MFHVKHLPFYKFSTLLLKDNNNSLNTSAIPIELLIHISDQSSQSTIFKSNNNLFSSIFNANGSSFDNVEYLPPKSFFNKNTPIGFKSDSRECRESVLSQVSSGVFPGILITTEEAYREKSFKIKPELSFPLQPDTDFDNLKKWLENAKFNFTEIVTNQGDYVLKGGMIDVYPYNKKYPIRISFLGEDIEIFKFDIESQMTNERVKVTRISPQTTGDTNSIIDVLPTKHLLFDLTENVNNIQINKDLSIENFLTVPFNEFVKNDFESYKTIVSTTLLNNGYLFKDQIIIPAWFLSRNSSLVDTNIHDAIDFNTLSKGDRVVHKHHGVGEFRGIFDFGRENISDERMLLEYSDSGKIYVSIQNLGLLEYFSSGLNDSSNLDNLSKKGLWNNKKKAAKKQANEIIDELLNTYAERSTALRDPFKFDNIIESQFINSFPFDETLDQTTSWNEVAMDLSSDKPMDRLLCGDVGFGKTEIALRAAFRSAYSGQQVAILAPTSILSNQHYQTFHARLSPFSIEVGLISAFKTKAENMHTLKDLSNGKINVIIGTHSLLSDSVKFSNLGLLVIDEEHRFGVKQKDKILSIKNNIDVLSMSATPIPRTLHMSLSGIKSISTINTPPKARFPIKTQVQFYEVEQIKSMIMFEVNRGGQVFFVHNNVKSLNEMVDSLKDLLPNLNIEPAHGQEPKKQLEKTMNHFIEGRIDVLVCTSIIETGIDIPNVNTIIINRAHRFGLSQLYQIRGRVGRTDKQAFAYLLIPKGFQLSINAYKRLKSIEKNTSLGSGYNISKSDMEIRGVGTIFGYKQSGGLSQIGYGLYSKMIKETLQERKIIEKIFIFEPEDISVKLFIDMAIPSEYINSEPIRLEFYRKLAKCDDFNRFSKIEYEIENRFGPIPQSFKNLINNYKTRIYCAKLGVSKCVINKHNLQFDFATQGVAGSIETFIPQLISLLQEQNTEPRFLQGDNKSLTVNIKLNKDVDIYTFVETILNKLTAIFIA